jgi:hypothetical protein
VGALAIALAGWGLWRLGGLLARFESKEPDDRLLRWALMIALVVIGLHGLLDDALYGNRGTPLVFVLAGLTVSLTGSPGPLGLRHADGGSAPRADQRQRAIEQLPN